MKTCDYIIVCAGSVGTRGMGTHPRSVVDPAPRVRGVAAPRVVEQVADLIRRDAA